ncbi:RHS repeat-associated core domain-containing protein [Cellulomonas triticagri]|uniref:RHS repeat-associated core domain-containing protein n=1 Tax=Cellulomonas triticagri TaxID=2483352 RepID=UPI0011C4255B|nr:RHS repeat-associated core domain-containing protein [Cellulomonas triticagri]
MPAAAATPVAPGGLAFERAATHTPVLAATVSDPDGGSVDGQFFARRAGSTGWDLADGARVSVTSGQVARFTLPALPAGQGVEWQVAACDATACSPVSALQSNRVQPLVGAGSRKNATTVGLQVGDRVSASVDVATGNLQVTASGLVAPGVTGDLPVDLAYNSLAIGSGTIQDQPVSPFGRGWFPTAAHTLSAQGDGSIVLHAGSGQAATFVPNGTGGWTPPAGITADLVPATGGGWTLTDHSSQQKWTFDAAGLPQSVADRNANTHTLVYGDGGSGMPTAVTATRGGADLDVDLTYDDQQLVEIAQGPANDRRSVELSYDSNRMLDTVTDALGRDTTFEYTGALLTKITAPGVPATEFTYDARGRVTAVTQDTGDAWTRFAYTSDTETLVSDPEQDQAGSPGTGPHTTYTLTSDMQGRVSKAVDAEGRERGATFTPNIDPATQTQGSGTGAQTTTYTYDANDGESLTNLATQGGASSTWEYGNTSASSKYSPSGMTDDAGNASLYTYNGTGNQLTSTDALAAEAALTYNADGTVATATAPGNTGNATTYGYDANKQLTSITPPTGTSLGVRNLTYDQYGRTATASNGNGVTTTYTYDDLDRLVALDHDTTTASPDVEYSYDNAGRVATREDVSGTTTYSYDALSRLTSRVHTLDYEPVVYSYDKSSRLKTTTDGRGTTEYLYDDAGAQIAQVTRLGDEESWTRFAVDDKGRRTDTWMRTNEDNTVWAAHSQSTYDPSGRLTGTKADSSIWGSNITPVVDITLCYTAGTTAPTCSGTAASDRSLIQWRKDNITGQVATYTYDGANRLTGVSVTAGTDGDGNPLPAETYTYTYDTRGNRLTATGPDGTQTRTYNAGNQTTTAGFVYDGAGNLITDPEAGDLTYTAGDQLATAENNGVWEYTYAGVGNGELLAQTDPNGQDKYRYGYGRTNSVGKPIIEQVYHSGSRAYLEHDANGTPLIIRSDSGNIDDQSLYVYDNLGSPIALITQNNTVSDAWEYDPYGVADLTEQSVTQAYTPFMYTGGLNDRVTGWTLNGARYYDAGEGRWTQMDTLDAPLDPSNGNRYAYAANNPINYVDPTGKVSASSVLGAIGLTASIVGLAATGLGAPLAVGAGLSAIGTAADVGSNLAAGNKKGALVAGVFGAVTAGFGGAGHVLGVSSRAAFGVEAGYSAVSIGAGLAANN